jgi:hypothetical protein
LGKEADFVVLDLKATALQALRQQRAKNLEDALFALMLMGDDRNIHATYVFGQCAMSKHKTARPRRKTALKIGLIAVACLCLLKRDSTSKKN